MHQSSSPGWSFGNFPNSLRWRFWLVGILAAAAFAQGVLAFHDRQTNFRWVESRVVGVERTCYIHGFTGNRPIACDALGAGRATVRKQPVVSFRYVSPADGREHEASLKGRFLSCKPGDTLRVLVSTKRSEDIREPELHCEPFA